MGTIKEKLALLAKTKQAIKAAIEAQGQAVGNIPFSGYAEKIEGIRGIKLPDGVNLGNSSVREFPMKINTAGRRLFGRMFIECKILETVPELDTSEGTDFTSMFGLCFSLLRIPVFDTSKGIYFDSMFENCRVLAEVPALNVSNGIYFVNMFVNCYALTEIPALDTSKGHTLSYMFYRCQKLTKITSVDLASANQVANLFKDCPCLTYALILNMGKNPDLTSLSVGYNTAWGTGGEINRKSLVDSLITCSFNRAAAGYSPCVIYLPAPITELLTEEEIAALTEKGFTLTQ